MTSMKVLIVLAFLTVACSDAFSTSWEKLIPSFSNSYVINGIEAAPNAAPYIVSLSRNFSEISHFCGGAIIHKNWILTAAHCIRGDPRGMGVVAGLHERINTNNEATQTREVDFGKVHESYGGSVGPYDIALLYVAKPFVFNKFVQTAVLPHREEIHTGETHLYGWGQTKPYNFTGADTLQTVRTEIVEWQACKEALRENSPLHWNNICSGSLQQGISACNGDSGGPLVKQNENGPSELIGVVSWGYIPCGKANLPSIYTRVSAYVDWIVKIQSAYYMLN